MAEVALSGLVKQFAGQRVVGSVDLRVPHGQLLVLVGPSGCGKTTTLRMIAGLETPDAGKIRIAGQIVNHLPPRKRDVAMVFQNYALYPHMTVRRNLAFGLRMRGVSRQETNRRVGAAADLLQIAPLLERRPAQLSGGQQQRVALGRAIVRDPAVFLLDEPLSNLDAQLRAAMRTELVRLHRQIGTTMIHVTHDQTEAMMMGDVVVVMNAGRIEQIDAPLDIYCRPATRFVAEFIGQWPMNFFRGQLSGDTLRVGDALWPQPAVAADGRPNGGPPRAVEVGIRPEALSLAADAAASTAAAPPRDRPDRPNRLRLEVQIELVQAMGAESLVHARWRGQTLAAAIRSTELPAAGQQAVWTVDADQLHLFDAASGRRLERSA